MRNGRKVNRRRGKRKKKGTNEIDRLVVDHDIGRVVIEYCRTIFTRESIRGIGNKHAA